MKFKIKPFQSFIISFIILFVVLKFWNFGIDEAYDKAIVNLSNTIATKYINKNPDLHRVFQLIYKKNENKELILIGSGNSKVRTPDGHIQMFGSQIDYSSFAYFPLILILSLIIATPIPIKRKIFALLGGVITAHIYIIIKIIIVLLDVKDLDLTFALGWGDSARNFVSFIYGFLITHTPTGTSILFCLLTWIIFSFKKDDFERFYNIYLGITPELVTPKTKTKNEEAKLSDKQDAKTNININKSKLKNLKLKK